MLLISREALIKSVKKRFNQCFPRHHPAFGHPLQGRGHDRWGAACGGIDIIENSRH